MSWDDLNELLKNIGGEQFDQESFQKIYDTDPRIKELVDKFDSDGVTLKGGAPVQSKPEDQTVDQMAQRATSNALS